MHIYLVRHAATAQSKRRTIRDDNKDCMLSAEGVAQAEALKKILASECGPSHVRVYVAPDKRCLQTASILSPTLTTQFVITEGLREINKGFACILEQNPSLGTMTIDEWETLYNNLSPARRNAFLYPSGESVNKLCTRAVATFMRIVKENDNDNRDVLIVSHNGPLRAIIAHVLGGKSKAYRGVTIMHGAYSEIIYRDGGSTLIKLNIN